MVRLASRRVHSSVLASHAVVSPSIHCAIEVSDRETVHEGTVLPPELKAEVCSVLRRDPRVARFVNGVGSPTGVPRRRGETSVHPAAAAVADHACAGRMIRIPSLTPAQGVR
eukprot:gene7528-biopygen870